MKGFKGFSKGLICRDKQYAENTIFEEPKATICECGIHFCENPLDVLDYYPLLDDDAELNEFAEVEALDNTDTDDNKKFCTTKLKIGAKLTFAGFVKAAIDFVFEKCKGSEIDNGDSAQLASSGYYAKLASSGDYAQLASSGYYAKLASSGDSAKLASSGNSAKLASSGYYAKLASSGNSAQLASSGDSAQLASSGDSAKLASSGNSAQLASSGDSAKLASSGNSAKLASSGYYAKLASSGNSAKLASSGNSAKLASSGKHSIVAGIGIENIAKAALGNWIVLAEWEYDRSIQKWIPKCVKSAQIDGETLKPDTYYVLKNGKFKEV